jgi:anti-anti-sigma regulatory factor
VLIIDITGVAVVDTGVAHHLLQAARAAQLLGAQVMLVGISPEVAQTVVQLGVNLSSLPTYSSLQVGLEHARRRTTNRSANNANLRQ